jgi:predicted dehydrogenase
MKHTLVDSTLTRRRFLALTGLAVAAPTLIPSRALGRGGEVAPSNRITMGIVGWGMQGPGNTRAFLGHANCQVVASCNIHKQHLQASLDTINGHYKNQDCKAYKDFREMMARKDIDSVMLAVPDNWHALIAVEAANNKKDIYGEKPLARTIAEQQAIVKAVQKNQRIWQTGSWQRSERNFHYGAEVARNGLLGKLKRVEVGLPSGHHDFAGTSKALIEKLSALPDKPKNLSKIVPGTPAWDLAITPPPADLDYDMWLGPSQQEPHIEARVFMNWRWNYNVGGGQLLDWIGHHCDIAHWGMDCDNSGPLEVEGVGEFPAKNAIWNTCSKYRVTLKYPNAVEMIIAGGHGDIKSGTKWIGADGWAWVDRGNAFESSNPNWVERRRLPDDARKVKLYESNDHAGNFLDCVKTRKPTITPVETAHHSAIPGHLGLIAMLTGHKLKWDAKREVIVGDEQASRLLTREYRKPWKLAGV